MDYILKRTNRKTLALQILDGTLIVRAPLNMPLDIIEGFVHKKEAWITKRLSSYIPVGFDIRKDEVYLFGQKVAVKRYRSQKFSVVLNDSIDVYVPNNLDDVDKINAKVEAYLKEALLKILDEMVPNVCSQLKIKTPPYKVRRYKRIYGRCSSKGELSFNTYLFHERLEFIHAVVVHECAHLIEFNHSKKFYDVIESILPNYRTIIRLNTCGYNLHQDQ